MSRRPSLPGAAELFRSTGGQGPADQPGTREPAERGRDRLRSLQRDAHVVDLGIASGAVAGAVPEAAPADPPEPERPGVYSMPLPVRPAAPADVTDLLHRPAPTPITELDEGVRAPAAQAYEQPSAVAQPRPTGIRQTRRQRVRPLADRRPSGRERHDEKITVYCSHEELFALETSRLTLRGEHGLVVDRGRIVREAVAIVLADLSAKGEDSIIVRRLREC